MHKALLLLLLAGCAAAAFFLVVPPAVDRLLNAVSRPQGRRPPSERARKLYAGAKVVDLHADTLLWGRDLLVRSARGQVDLPRLIEGNVAVQAFTVVTTTPRIMRLNRNEDDTDNIALLALAQRWPARTRKSPFERALYQARRLREAADRSAGKLTVLRSRADLEAFLERRREDPRIVAGFLGAEGAQPLEGDLRKLDALHDAGFRMMSPTHFTDTAVASSAHGVRHQGLTSAGRAWLARMEEKRMIVDLAHAAHGTVRDVLALATRPVVVSHTGVRGTCDNDRNLTDDELRGVARTGGVVGIAYFRTAVCDASPRGIARAIRHAANVAGVEHVALGSDFDGAVHTPFDAASISDLVDPLLQEGFSDQEVKLILGENTLRVLRAALP